MGGTKKPTGDGGIDQGISGGRGICGRGLFLGVNPGFASAPILLPSPPAGRLPGLVFLVSHDARSTPLFVALRHPSHGQQSAGAISQGLLSGGQTQGVLQSRSVAGTGS